ncbi:MAG: zinc chelation protein SecC [Leptothrix sp. (in: Bacteria)]|nr:zinc chelation protein SecC [Leptothrix sp. (in: b-proteobacteria)]
MNIHPLRSRDHEDAARVAITWLAERHRKGWRSAFEELLDQWRPEGPEDGWQLDEDGMTMVSINAGEWLIARGEIPARGGLREINGYLLGRDGPYLTPGQRDWIAQLRAQPLRLYRVTDVRPGEGLTLLDEFDPQAEPRHVREISGSRTARPGMLMGARLMHVEAGAGAGAHWELSGAVYPFSKLHEASVLARLGRALTGAAELQLHADNQRDLVEMAIARAWLDQWLEPVPMPQIHDASTGEPILLVTDHYRVCDAAALAKALAAQSDVDGDPEQGWNRMSQGADGAQRSLSAINPGREAGRIEVFHRTQRLADEGRAWFETLAGVAVQHLAREITDPVGHLARTGTGDASSAPNAAAFDAPDLPPEVIAQAMEQVIHRHYANWSDEAIPALGGLTPRQAITTPAGLERVKGLLREYEDGEQRQSAAQGRSAVSYQFLWDALGISRSA